MTKSHQAERAERLRDLHGKRPLVLPNVWDAMTARAFVDAGFEALATPSTAIAGSLGYEDGQRAPAREMFAAATRIAAAVDVPVTVDAEAGYGLSPDAFVDALLATGAVGCNLEDTAHPSRDLVPVHEQAAWLSEIRRFATARGVNIVINARVDVLLHGGPVDEAVDRARRYLDAGADCVYPISLDPSEETVKELVARIPGPVNVLYLPYGPALPRLGELGVARVTFGGGLYDAVLDRVRHMADRIAQGENPYSRT